MQSGQRIFLYFIISTLKYVKGGGYFDGNFRKRKCEKKKKKLDRWKLMNRKNEKNRGKGEIRRKKENPRMN